MKTATILDRKLLVLLRDFGFEVQGDCLISRGIKGWTGDRIITRVRGLFDAAEFLRPYLSDRDYTARLNRIIGG